MTSFLGAFHYPGEDLKWALPLLTAYEKESQASVTPVPLPRKRVCWVKRLQI